MSNDPTPVPRWMHDLLDHIRRELFAGERLPEIILIVERMDGTQGLARWTGDLAVPAKIVMNPDMLWRDHMDTAATFAHELNHFLEWKGDPWDGDTDVGDEDHGTRWQRRMADIGLPVKSGTRETIDRDGKFFLVYQEFLRVQLSGNDKPSSNPGYSLTREGENTWKLTPSGGGGQLADYMQGVARRSQQRVELGTAILQQGRRIDDLAEVSHQNGQCLAALMAERQVEGEIDAQLLQALRHQDRLHEDGDARRDAERQQMRGGLTDAGRQILGWSRDRLQTAAREAGARQPPRQDHFAAHDFAGFDLDLVTQVDAMLSVGNALPLATSTQHRAPQPQSQSRSQQHAIREPLRLGRRR